MIHGIINVYKEAGYTSFDVVAKLRGICKQKKIGHTGTLDPAAEGVLPVCFGNGTKLCDMLTDRSKGYEAVLLLGVDTDTLDTTGQVLNTSEVNASEDEVKAAIESFVGEYDQIPPMYSALKVDGKRLYELARQGKEVERKARRVTIHKIEILEMDLPRVRILVDCSKGTYIRSLCQDIGNKLGCYGCMESLLRVRSGRFDLQSALKLSEIEKYRDEGKLSEIVIPLEDVLEEYPVLHVLPECKKLIDNGNPLTTDCFEEKFILEAENLETENLETENLEAENSEIENSEKVNLGTANCEKKKFRVYNAEGLFFAVYEWNEDKQKLMPDKIFPINE